MKKWLQKISKDRGYKEKSRQPILPSDVKNFHENVKSHQYNVDHLSHYVIMIFAIRFGLRYTGFSLLSFESFEIKHHLWKFLLNKIDYLIVRICKKLDNDYTLYKVPFTDSHPHLCLLRHLLILVHILPYNNGYLLPTNIDHPNDRKTDDAAFKYFNDIRQTIFEHGTTDKLNFGNQTFRVSYYLFGTLGFGTFEELRDNARHKTDKMATKYFQDSRSV